MTDEKERVVLKVGDVIYLFSESHRVYAKDETGRAYGGPIYSKCFQPMTITGETKTHWLVGEGYALDKVNKKTMRAAGGRNGARCYYDDAGKEDAIWRNQHAYRIIEKCRNLTTDQLRKIAEIIKFDPEQ